jgi:hypothetical protein
VRKATSIFILAAGLLLAGIAWAAVTPNNGTFKGKTAQGYPVSITVKNSTVRVYKYRYQIGGCGSTTKTTGKIPVTNGKFKDSSSYYDANAGRYLTTVVTGAWGTAKSVKGTIKAATACGTKSIGYKASL